MPSSAEGGRHDPRNDGRACDIDDALIAGVPARLETIGAIFEYTSNIYLRRLRIYENSELSELRQSQSGQLFSDRIQKMKIRKGRAIEYFAVVIKYRFCGAF